MPTPRSPRRRKNSDQHGSYESDIDTSTSDTVSVMQPSWNTSLHEVPPFADNLAKWLPTVDSRYTTLVKGRYVLSGRYVIAVSLNHIDRLVAKSFAPGTFRAPFVVAPGDLEPFRIGTKVVAAAEGASVAKGESALPANARVQLAPSAVSVGAVRTVRRHKRSSVPAHVVASTGGR